MEPQATKDEAPWSEADLKWLETVPEALHPIAKRHGRQLFSIVMQAGQLSYALGIVGQLQQFLHGKHSRTKLAIAMQAIQQTSNDLCLRAISGIGKELKDFLECKQDIERMAVLADGGKHQEGDRVSPGGIVLDS